MKDLQALIDDLRKINSSEKERFKLGGGGKFARGVIAANESTIKKLEKILLKIEVERMI